MKRPMLRALAPLLMMLALAACSSAKTATYTLKPVPPRAGAVSGHALRPPIEVGQIALPATIDRNAIVLTAPGDRLEVQQTSVWGAPLRELIRSALSHDLSARLPQGSVLAPGTPAPKGGLRILTVAIQHFAGSTDGRVALDADWTIARSGHQPKGQPNRERIVIQAGSGTAQAVVPAMSAALGRLADRIADQLD